MSLGNGAGRLLNLTTNAPSSTDDRITGDGSRSSEERLRRGGTKTLEKHSVYLNFFKESVECSKDPNDAA